MTQIFGMFGLERMRGRQTGSQLPMNGRPDQRTLIQLAELQAKQVRHPGNRSRFSALRMRNRGPVDIGRALPLYAVCRRLTPARSNDCSS
jgi:hypothetical protein